MFERFGIEFIIHLGQLSTFRAGQLAGMVIKCSGIVLNTEEIIAFNVRHIMAEFLIPCLLHKCFSALIDCLQIMQGQG